HAESQSCAGGGSSRTEKSPGNPLLVGGVVDHLERASSTATAAKGRSPSFSDATSTPAKPGTGSSAPRSTTRRPPPRSGPARLTDRSGRRSEHETAIVARRTQPNRRAADEPADDDADVRHDGRTPSRGIHDVYLLVPRARPPLLELRLRPDRACPGR